MTTATDTELDVNTEQKEVERCGVTWWKPGPNNTRVVDFVCDAPVTHRVIAHTGANLLHIEHRISEDGMCERCLNEAMILWCGMHNCAVVIRSYKI